LGVNNLIQDTVRIPDALRELASGVEPRGARHKQSLDAGAGELLDQENLVRVSSAEAVGRINEDGLSARVNGPGP
jgi:hypothetical protein